MYFHLKLYFTFFLMSDISNSNPICNICRTNHNYFIKICTCLESRVCSECYINLHIYRHITCPLCRKELNITKHRNYKKICYDLSKIALKIFIILFIECIIPIIYFSGDTPNDYANYKENHIQWISKDKNIILLTCICVLILQPLNIILINYASNIIIDRCINTQKTVIINICILHSLIECIIFMIATPNVAWYFFMFVLFPFYICMCMVSLLYNICYYISIYLCRFWRNITHTRIQPISHITGL